MLGPGRDKHQRPGAHVLLLTVHDHASPAAPNPIHLLALLVGMQRLLAPWGPLHPGHREVAGAELAGGEQQVRHLADAPPVLRAVADHLHEHRSLLDLITWDVFLTGVPMTVAGTPW